MNGGVKVIVEQVGIPQMFDEAGELQTLLIEGAFESFESEAAEQTEQYLHGRKKRRPRQSTERSESGECRWG